MVGKRVIGSHGPGICGNIIDLDVKIGADSAACDPVDFAVEVSRGMEVGRDSIRRQARVVGIGGRVITPKRGRGVKVLVNPAQQIDICAITDRGQPVASAGQGSNRAPAIGRRRVLVSVCDSDVGGDASEAIHIATL